MSQGGEVTTQQLVYGPDGKVYGNPALARAAGVNQTYRQDGTPYPVAQQTLPTPMPYNQPMPAPSFGGMGSVDPYSQIMAQMTPTMNPYTGAGVAIGGYDPRLYNNAFMGSNSRLNLSGLLGGGMGGGGGYDQPLDARTAAFFDNETKEARDARMGQVNDVLSMLAPGALFGRAASGLLSSPIAGGIANFFSAPASQPNYGVPVENMGTYSGMPSMGQTSYASGVGNPGESYGGFTSYESGVGNPGESYAGGYTSSETGVGNPGESYGGPTSSESGVGNPGESGGGPTSSESGVGNPGESSGGYGASGDGDSGYAKGGKVTKDRLKGPDPKGPDEGYGALLSGEYVIKKSAVKKYGQGLLDMINDGKIPAKKMKSLLG